MREARYWLTLFYNGVVIGIWPSAAAAYVMVTYLHSTLSFVPAFAVCMWFCIPIIVCLYHFLIVPRRKRRKQGSLR